MQIQVNTDNTMESREPLVAHVETALTEQVRRFKAIGRK